MSETIIIESNRQIAYKQEKQALLNTNQNLANVVLPNNQWKTRLEAGVKIEVGDEIQVEAVMVNTRGSPEETIEFSGVDSVQSATDVIDNKVMARFQKYITNRHQFNCNLPLVYANCNRDPQGSNYGYMSFGNFTEFMSAYPYRGIEGMEFSNGSWNEVKGAPTPPPQLNVGGGGGVFVKAPQPLDDCDTTKLYLGTDTFKGYGELDIESFWDFATTDIELEVETGFNTPSKIGESLTAQLHQRQGVPTNWDEKAVSTYTFGIVPVTPVPPSIAIGKFVAYPNAGITDQSYQTVPTSTGDIFRARNEAKWSAGIAGEVPYDKEGIGYVPQQGNDVFHRNLLCGNPQEYKNVYGWLRGRVNAKSSATISLANYETTGLYTGNTNINADDVGNYGLNPIMLNNVDWLDYNNYEVGLVTWHNWTGTGFGKFLSTGDANINSYLKIEEPNTLWATNIVYNNVNINNLSVGWTDCEIPINNNDSTKNATPLTVDLSKQFSQNLYYGRADDERSAGKVGNKINLSPSSFMVDPPATVRKSYVLIDGVYTLMRPAGFASWNSRNEIPFWSRYDPTFDQLNLNKTTLSFPTTDNQFSLTDSNGKYYPQTHSKSNNMAIIPVFYKQSELVENGGTIPNSLKDIPFCAFVSIYELDPKPSINPRLLPCPMLGEFFGRSPSCYDNLLSKVTTTQKTFSVTNTGTKPPNNIYPLGDDETHTRTYCYMPYCMIGADNPSIQFDDTYGRFTISGLSTAVRAGNGVFQEPPDEPNSQADTESLCAFSLESAMCGISPTDATRLPYSSVIQNVNYNPIISAQSGISLQSIFLYVKNGTVDNSNPLNPRFPTRYEGTLFSKLGFELEQLIPYIGTNQAQFNRGTYNQYLGTDKSFVQKYNTMVSPVTTNAYISASDQLSMVKNSSEQIMANLGGCAVGQSVFINGESDSLIAVNLPAKLDYSYLIVYSNIVQNTQFYGGGNGQQKIPAMAYVTRNYSTGDFFFGQQSSWSYIADKEYIVTEFDTNITLPNGLPAPIENNSSIIYKITKMKTLPPPPPPPPPNSEPKKK